MPDGIMNWRKCRKCKKMYDIGTNYDKCPRCRGKKCKMKDLLIK